MDKRKILLSFFVLGSLLASLALTCNIFGTGMQHSFAQSSGVTVTDFSINGGQEPWGTTFDSNGQCVGGCSGMRSDTDTAAQQLHRGKSRNIIQPLPVGLRRTTLPAGYAQPLFLAFDAQGNLWFPMPMANAIGMLNPVSKTFQQIPVPTSGAGPVGYCHRSQRQYLVHRTLLQQNWQTRSRNPHDHRNLDSGQQ